jgi:hypothetical protein
MFSHCTTAFYITGYSDRPHIPKSDRPLTSPKTNCLQQRNAYAPPHPRTADCFQQRNAYALLNILKKRSHSHTPKSDRSSTSPNSDRSSISQTAIALSLPKSDRPSQISKSDRTSHHPKKRTACSSATITHIPKQRTDKSALALSPSHIPKSELLAAAQRLRTPTPQKAIRTELFHIHKNKSCYKFNQLNTS